MIINMSEQSDSVLAKAPYSMRSSGCLSAIKKTLFHPKADELSRLLFQRKLFQYEVVDKRPIVYLDESGFCVDAPRERGYSLTGVKCYASKDWHAKGRVNAIGAICRFKLLSICLFPCNIDADVFYQWLTQELLPNIPEHSVIVLDNATFHKRNDALLAVQQLGHTLEFLPPYSPDLNPIEKKWAQAKSIRRKFGYSVEELFIYSDL